MCHTKRCKFIIFCIFFTACAVYTTDDYEEPPFRYVPEVPLLQMPSQRGNGSESIQSPLTASMLLLAEAIETDISNQFDLLTRRKPELTCDAAKDQENSSKNRYRDILPCKILHFIISVF